MSEIKATEEIVLTRNHGEGGVQRDIVFIVVMGKSNEYESYKRK